MSRELQMFAKEQQLKLIDNILRSLCIIELNSEGRKYLKKIKKEINKELDDLRSLKVVQNNNLAARPNGFKFRFSEAIKNSW